MDWKQLIADLIAAGLTQVRIAEACEVSQSTISDLARGATKSPAYDLGRRLERLHDEHCPTGGARERIDPPKDRSPVSKFAA